jgi:uncharacterized protein with von Willebrand factor type A (vWA) domain
MTIARLVLALDYSMPLAMDGLWEVAKELAMTTARLSERHGPVRLMGYSQWAHVLTSEALTDLQWDFCNGTNLHAALQLARDLLDGEGPKRAIFVADSEPTNHCLPNGEVFFNYPTTPETEEATLAEGRECSRAGIRIDFLLLRADSPVREFAERIAEMGDGSVWARTVGEEIKTTAERFVGSIDLA